MMREFFTSLLYSIGGTIALLSTIMLGWHTIHVLVTHQRTHIALILMVALSILSTMLRLPYSWEKVLIRIRALLQLGLSVTILVLMCITLRN